MKKLLSFSLCVAMLALPLTACRTTATKEPINEPEPSISIPAEPAPEITQESIPAPEVQHMEPINIEQKNLMKMNYKNKRWRT